MFVNYFITKSFFICSALMFLSSCVNQAPIPVTSVTNTQAPLPFDRNIDDWRESDSDRKDLLERVRSRSRDCAENDECEDICRDIYSHVGSRRDCAELSFSQVQQLEEIHELLESPDLEDLYGIDTDDLDIYINVSIKALDGQIRGWTRRQAEEVLSWIALSKKIASIFSKEDKDYKWLKEILLKISSARGSQGYQEALEEDLGEGNFIELALNPKDQKYISSSNLNKEALSWLHDFIEDEKVGECPRDPDSDEDRVKCLKLYCSLARTIDNTNVALDWITIDKEFSKYIEKIIDDKIGAKTESNSRGWNSRRVKEVEHLSLIWWNDLC